MNGTLIDVPGINVNISTYGLQDSTDKASVITIKDENHQIIIEVCFGKISRIKVNEKEYRIKHQ